MSLPVEFYVYVGYGLFAIVLSIAGVGFILGGLLKPFFEVKRSRGSKLLVRVRHPVQDYFRAGHIDEGVLIWVDRQKNTRRIPMTQGVVSRAATIFWVEVDDEKNCFYTRANGDAVSTYDAVKVDSYIQRALVRPGIFGDQTIKLLMAITIVGVLVMLLVAFLVYKNGVALNMIIESTRNVGVIQ